MAKRTELTKEQKDLMTGLQLFGLDNEAIIVIMLLTQRSYQTEMMIDYILDNHQTMTESSLLEKAVEISKIRR